jgi:hypothetical protein
MTLLSVYVSEGCMYIHPAWAFFSRNKNRIYVSMYVCPYVCMNVHMRVVLAAVRTGHRNSHRFESRHM